MNIWLIISGIEILLFLLCIFFGLNDEFDYEIENLLLRILLSFIAINLAFLFLGFILAIIIFAVWLIVKGAGN